MDVQSLATMADELGCPLSELLGEEQLQAAREGTKAARCELKIIYVVLALLWVPAIALDLTERVSGGEHALGLVRAARRVRAARLAAAWRL